MEMLNVEVEDSITLAYQELERMTESMRVEDRSTLERATEYLEESASALKMRQKLIKVADRSEFGWGVACHYQADHSSTWPQGIITVMPWP